MSRRFSQIFVPPRSDVPKPNVSNEDRDVLEAVEVFPERGRKRDTMKNFANFLFSRKTRSPSPAPPPRPIKSAIAIPRHISTPSSLPNPSHSRRDSGIGSEKSSIENIPIRPRQSILSAHNYRQLQTLLQDLEISLKEQGAMSHSLSRNLLSLMAVKELYIKASPRINQDWKVALTHEMSSVREELRALFTRKATLTQRSLAQVSELCASIAEAERTDHGARLDVENIAHVLERINSDMKCQGCLSEGVIDALTRKCWKTRWVRSTNQRVEMRRFVGFVVERVGRLHGSSRKTENVMRAMHRIMLRAETL